MDTSLTRPQLALFWRKFAAACSAQGFADREAYRHAVLREEGGVEHLADLDRTGGFDRVMLRLCIDAGDWQGASHFETGTERRIAELCADCATQLLQLAGADETSALAYIGGILRQARLDPPSPCGGDWWLDVPEGHAVKVFQILDTHRRRLLRAADGLKTYVHGRRWERLSDGTLRHIDAPPPVPVRFRVVA